LRLGIADLEMDLTTRKVTRAAQRIDLTPTEFDLLQTFLRNKGHVVSREMLVRDVWDGTSRATPINNVIDVHVSRLRRKIDDPFEKKLLTTVRGVGFLLSEEEEA
jgi:DNA-binding response OmpR family regulator